MSKKSPLNTEKVVDSLLTTLGEIAPTIHRVEAEVDDQFQAVEDYLQSLQLGFRTDFIEISSDRKATYYLCATRINGQHRIAIATRRGKKERKAVTYTAWSDLDDLRLKIDAHAKLVDLMINYAAKAQQLQELAESAEKITASFQAVLSETTNDANATTPVPNTASRSGSEPRRFIHPRGTPREHHEAK
jgi:hypothetical protein